MRGTSAGWTSSRRRPTAACSASRPAEQADDLLDEARRHLESAQDQAEEDATGACSLLPDDARKALVAIPEDEGLRPTSRGGHLAADGAVRAQSGENGSVLRPSGRMRRRRNEAEHPSRETPRVTTDDVLDDVPTVQPLIDLAGLLLDQMSLS